MSKNSLQERVRELRAERFSQTELAERAELAPAALSRILSGERAPRMEHLLALATALDVTITELVDGTDAASAIRDWVARGTYEESEARRFEAEKECLQIRGQVDALEAEKRSLRSQMTKLQEELARQSQQIAELTALAEGERAARVLADGRARDNLQQLQNSQRALEEALDRVKQLKADLDRSGKTQVATGAFAAALGALAGAAMASDTRSSKRRY